MESSILLSQRVDCLTRESIDKRVYESIKRKKKTLVFAMNVHILLELRNDQPCKEKHNNNSLIFCDGVPLVWLSKLSWYSTKSLPGRVSGTDLVERILQNDRYKIYIIGSTLQILKRIVEKYPKNICGFFAPPFGNDWNEKVDEVILTQIKKTKPDIVLIGVGPLKQEKWLIKHSDKINAFVGIGVGSAFDILSGTTPRAPSILRNNGLEWLWRVVLEPKRLLRRYLTDFLHLTWLIISKPVVRL